MKENCEVKIPVRLNCWKHHAKFILQQVSEIKTDSDIHELNKKLLVIGESQMDLYFGKLLPSEISSFIISELKIKKLLEHDSYYSWLAKEGNKYKLLTLTDGSVWTLRYGNEPGRYVHIHPGRYSEHTIRVKSTTLKTSIFILVYQKMYPDLIEDISFINKVRKEFLNIPPIKSIKRNSGLAMTVNLFYSI